MPVPYTFGSATSSIPLSQLDSNFATAITIGNTAVQLGNTVTTLNNMTLANVTISSGNVTITNVSVTTANATTANIGTLVVTSNATVGGNISVTGNVSMNVGTITTANVTTANIATSIVTTSQTLSYGTANGVVYLNTSKVATTGTDFVFDGTKVGIGTSSPSAKLQTNSTDGTIAIFRTTSGANNTRLNIDVSDTAATAGFSVGGNSSFPAFTFSNGGAERMRIDSSGNVGIGTSSPAAKLHVDGTIRYTNRPAAGTITAIGFDTNGDLKASSSSLRYKHDIEDYNKGLSEVMQLRAVVFKFNGEDRTNIGFIAEEINEIGLTEVMLYNEEEKPEGVIYANMVSLLTKAIQELKAELDIAKAEIAALKGATP